MKTERRAFERVTDLLDEAVKVDPGAFPPNAIVVYWPEMTNDRQAAAFDKAAINTGRN